VLAVVLSPLAVVGLAAPASADPPGPQLGDVYVADPQHSRVVVFSADGHGVTTVGSGLRYPQGVAVDDDGNVYIADRAYVTPDPTTDDADGKLIKVSADGVQTTLLSDLYVPFGVATDGAGHVFVSDLASTGGAGGVYRVNTDGSGRVRVDTGGENNAGLATDPLGNLYAATPYDSSVRKVATDGTTTRISVDAWSWDVAADALGDVYVASFNGLLTRIRADGTLTPASGLALGSPYGIAVGADGVVLVADSLDSQVTQVGPDGDLLTPIGSGEFAIGPYDVAVYAPPARIVDSTPPAGELGAPY
jgi:sugar lactone lactonase YvrE